MDNIEPTKPRWLNRATPILRGHGMFMLLVACAIVVGAIPVLLSIFAPELNNSVLIAICTSGQFFVSVFAGVAWTKAQAIKEANMRWVPMAASACDRLATILSSVANLKATVSQACSAASKNLPELAENKNRAVRIHFEGLCSSNATRLNDVESHLDSALADWERFIKQNCNGPECADIGRRLALLRARQDAVAVSAQGCSASSQQNSEEPPNNVDELDLNVNGVTTRAGRNGKWKMRRVSDDYWDSEVYALRKQPFGWFLEDKSDPDSYFFRQGVATQCGFYARCDVCPDDGTAVIASREIGNRKDDQMRMLPAEETSVPGQTSQMVSLVLGLDGAVQHAALCHGISTEVILAAITKASSVREYSTLLNIHCPDVVSICAIPALNLVRGMLGKSPFEYDAKLFEEIKAKASEHHANTSENAAQLPSAAV